ncbi:hypothetical protein [Alkalibaculum bacchi]|jgi:hypothetical protein|uniref:hypothetical protein n=1 Tax=Alkalibaculum bacchi TaxID=645887 RepID=UPI0026E9C239|nr:hypothetical protein [Alkalibaculum bacchi]
MHYITEGELRDRYAHQPYSTYELPPDAKLTPSAKQFLNDFRITFNTNTESKSSNIIDNQAELSVAKSQYIDVDALLVDTHLLGSELRLFSRNALSIDNVLAYSCDELGKRWVGARVVSDFAADGSNKVIDPALPENTPLPLLDARIHPIYFEASVLYMKIAKYIGVWKNAKTHVASSDLEAVSAWICEASGICGKLSEAINESIDKAKEAM